MRTLGLIPARAGSRRLPGKNKANCAGKPLVMWTVEAALCSDLDCVVVSTDDWDICDLAYPECEIRVRPPQFCTDRATSRAVIRDALEHFPGYDRVMLLQPTSPLRDVWDIQKCLHDHDTVLSVSGGDMEPLPNGAIYLMRTDALMQYADRYEMAPYRSIDIDDAVDLREAERRLLEQR